MLLNQNKCTTTCFDLKREIKIICNVNVRVYTTLQRIRLQDTALKSVGTGLRKHTVRDSYKFLKFP